jgi:hypothetical protein
MKNLILFLILGFFFQQILSTSKAGPPEPFPETCLELNVVFPIVIQGRNYYCGERLGYGSYASFFSLVDENHKDSEFGIKIFQKKEQKGPEEELNQIKFFREYIKSIPEVIQYSIQTDEKNWKKNSNYIIKKRIYGNEIGVLYERGCFLEPDELKNEKDIERCRESTGNSTGKQLLEGLRALLEELKSFDNLHTGFIIGDLHGGNILWDIRHKTMVIVDFEKWLQTKQYQTSLGKLGSNLNDGYLFGVTYLKNIPEKLASEVKTKLSKSIRCLEKQKVQNFFREYVPIEKWDDLSKIDCSTLK